MNKIRQKENKIDFIKDLKNTLGKIRKYNGNNDLVKIMQDFYVTDKKQLMTTLLFIKKCLPRFYKSKILLVGVVTNISELFNKFNLNAKSFIFKEPEFLKVFFKHSLHNLNKINLSHAFISIKGCKLLADWNNRIDPKLISLKLSFSAITEEALEILSNSNFRFLEILDLSNNLCGNGIKFLGQGSFKNLKNLNLSSCEISPVSLEPFSKGNFENLISLNLENNTIYSEGADHIAKGNFPKLESLNLRLCEIDNFGINFLSNGNLINLNDVNLYGNYIRDEGIKFLSKGSLFNLRKINLSGNYIGDEGVQFLSLENLKNLTDIDLSRNIVGEEGIKFLSIKNFSSNLNINLNNQLKP